MEKQPIFKQRWVWIVGAIVIGAIIALTLLAGFSYQSRTLLQKGWINYPGEVSALAIDKQGQVWVAYNFSADSSKNITMYTIEGEPVEILLPGELAEDRGMSALAIDPQDRVWVGSWNGAVGVRETDGQWVIYTPKVSDDVPPSIIGNPVWDIVFDSQGRAWVRSGLGLGVIDPAKNNTIVDYAKSDLPNAGSIAVDEKGQLWAKIENAIKTLEADGEWRTVFDPSRCQSDCPDLVGSGSALAIDHQGQVWVGTNDGVSVLRLDGTWQSHTVGNPNVVNEMEPILVDRQGRVWVGTTRQGLFRLDPNTGWTTYTSGNSGLAGDGVAALAIDNQGRVWIGTDAGLSMLDVEVAAAPQNIQTTSRLLSAVIPSLVLAILLTIGLAVAFTGNGAFSRATLRDLSIGFLGWFIVITLYWGGIGFIGSQMGSAAIALFFCLFIPLPLTIIVLAILLFKKRWSSLGILSAFVVNAIGLFLSAPPVTDPYYHSPLFDIFSMIPFFLNSLSF